LTWHDASVAQLALGLGRGGRARGDAHAATCCQKLFIELAVIIGLQVVLLLEAAFGGRDLARRVRVRLLAKFVVAV